MCVFVCVCVCALLPHRGCSSVHGAVEEQALLKQARGYAAAAAVPCLLKGQGRFEQCARAGHND